jgi:hypothetical protein
MRPDKTVLARAGKLYQESLALFKDFLAEVCSYEAEIPSLKFEMPTETRVDFQFRGNNFRWRVRGEQDDHENPTACIVCMIRPDHGDQVYKPHSKCPIVRQIRGGFTSPGKPGLVPNLYLSPDGQYGATHEQVFLYLLTGKKD